MTMSFHVMPFEKRFFEKGNFLLKYHQNPQVPKRRSIGKKREKEEKEKKAPRVSSNKRRSQYFE
jgi:hypothetical protein